jgi:uncharacterized protein YkwD
MAIPLRRIFLALAIASLALSAVFAAAPFASSAHADACHRFGTKRPGTISKHDSRRAILCLLNKKRAQHGRGPLNMNTRIEIAAQRHTEYMEDHHCFSHQCSGEASLVTRLSSVDYLTGGLLSWSAGENIGWGTHRYATARQMVRAWMHSPEHRANILYSFHDIGIGVVWGTPQSAKADGAIYTTDFGYRYG